MPLSCPPERLGRQGQVLALQQNPGFLGVQSGAGLGPAAGGPRAGQVLGAGVDQHRLGVQLGTATAWNRKDE